ncbi:MAG: hypothetical protein AAF230_04280 [Pseudomonadota bacterium]
MVALKTLKPDWHSPEIAPQDRGETGFLNHLRFVALGCRAQARTDLFEACALLTTIRSQSLRAHAEALMLCLSQALGKQAIFFRPGVDEHSFDEDWLLRLSRALAEGDEASATFLLQSRVAKEHHRHIRFLLGRICRQFPLS